MASGGATVFAGDAAMKAKMQHLRMISTVRTQVGRERDLRAILDKALPAIERTLDFESFAVLLLDERAQTLTLAAITSILTVAGIRSASVASPSPKHAVYRQGAGALPVIKLLGFKASSRVENLS